MLYVNPDNFLGNPRIFTDERSREAWRACKDLVERTLDEAREPHNFYVVCGVQGSGKTQWVKDNPGYFREPAIVLDAALSHVQARAGPVAQGRRFACRMICVWISCQLDTSLARNRSRTPDQVIADDVIRLVFNTFEPPTVDEGFDEVFKVDVEFR